jgi:hypothetical protein
MVDMTARMEDMFLAYVKSARTLAGIKSFRDSAGVYQGLADRLLSRFNARVPGKVLNLIDPEFVTDQLIDYDDEALYEKNLDLLNSPEGGMGNVFALKSFYSNNPPFMHNTNTIRTGLGYPKQMVDYTSIGITNVLWVLEDMYLKDKPKDYDHNTTKLIEYLYPVKEKGKFNWDKRVVFLKNKTLSTYDKAIKDNEEIILDFTEETLETLKEIGFDGSGRNILTPDVITAEDNHAYNKDVYIKNGVNLKVTFTNHGQAFEDVPLMDYDAAMALGWNEGYKTWLGKFYGFKGGVKLVKGLYKQYGSHIVASADSVVKRGSYGALVDMAIHNIGTAILRRSKEDFARYGNFIKAYDDKNSVLHKYITINKEGKFIVSSNINYTNFFNEKSLFNSKHTIEEKLDSVLKVDLSKAAPYKTLVKDKLVEVSGEGSKGWQGTLYVILDSEKITDNVANKAELKDFGGIATAKVDESGTVLSGVVLSLSVLYPMLAKSKSVNWTRAFYNTDDAQEVINENKKVNDYTEIIYTGVEGLLKKYGVTNEHGYNVGETINNMIVGGVNHNIVGYAREYLVYKHKAQLSKDSSFLEDANFRMAELNKKIRQEAHNRFVGKEGVLNSALFKKHVGGRQQLLANTELRLGTVATNSAIWHNNIKANPNWLQYEAFKLNEFEEDVNQHVYKNGEVYNWKKESDGNYTLKVDKKHKKMIETRLNSVGIIEGIRTSVDNSDGTTEFKINLIKVDGVKAPVLGRAYGWMLSMRSPVQDYNAVPLMKVVGFHDHQALEANKYLYGMIGGDNDGDTLGMILIDKNQYEYLKELDATQIKYYDKGYFEKVDEDYITEKSGKYFNKKTLEITDIDIETSNVGKKTFGQYKKDTPIRTSYTQDELYLQTFSDLSLEDANVKKVLKGVHKDFESIIMKDEKLLRTYTNVIVRFLTGGYDNFQEGNIKNLKPEWKPFNTNEGYNNIDAMKKFVKLHLEETEMRYTLSEGLKNNDEKILDLIKLKKNDVYSMFSVLEKKDRDYLNDTYKLHIGKEVNTKANVEKFLMSKEAQDLAIKKILIERKVISRLFQKTVTRVQGSKNGIEKFGGARKIQLISSLILRLGFINRDAKGEVLDSIGAYAKDENGVMALTPVSFATAVYKKEFINNISKLIQEGKTFEDVLKLSEKERTTLYKDKEGNEVSLKELLKTIDPSTSKEELDAALKEVYTTALELLYDAHTSSNKVLKQFPDLAKAFNLKNGYTFLDFFNEHYKTKEAQAALYPPVKKLIEVLKTRDKKVLLPWEMEWVKIQFFGAQQREADAFFRLVKDNKVKEIDTRIKKYSEQYLKEHIIGRKEFKIMSNKATEVIGVAKHQGSDQQTHKWLEAYVAKLTEEVAKHNIRLTNVDSKRQYLSLAIAMDRNPFEKYKEYGDIMDEDYNERLYKRKVGTRATLLPEYRDTKQAMGNLNAITKDSMSIQLLNRLGAHDSIIKEVEEAVFGFVGAFEVENIGTTEGLIRAAKEAEHYAQILLNYGIAGYKIRNFIDDYMFNYEYINDTLVRYNKNAIPLNERNEIVKYSTSFMEIMYKIATRSNREKYDALIKKYAPTTNKILQSDIEVDLDYYHTEEGNLVRRTDNNEAGYNTFDRDYAQEELSYISLDSGQIPRKMKFSQVQNKVLEMYLRKLSLNVSDEYKGVKEVLENFINEYNIMRASYYKAEQKIEELKKEKESGKRTPEEKRRAAEYKGLYNNKLIEDDLHNLSMNNNEYHKLKQNVKKLESQKRLLIKQLEKNKNTLEKLIIIAEELKKFKTKKERIKRIDEEIKMYEDRIKSVEETIETFVFNKTFSELTVLAHSDDDDNYTVKDMYTYTTPKYLTDSDLVDIHNKALVSINKQISPILEVLAPFIITQKDGSKVLDAKAAYEWLELRQDYAKLVIVRRGDNDEGLLKRLFNTIFIQEKDKKGNTKVRRAFKTHEELVDALNKLNEGEDQKEIIFSGTKYEGIDPKIRASLEDNLSVGRYITPTVKEINIRGPEDLQYLYNQIKSNNDIVNIIGFLTRNNLMDSYDMAYIPFKHTGIGADFLQRMYSMSKLLQRLSAGFLIRNWIDTWNQLYSENQQRYGVIGALFKTPEIIKIMIDTSKMKAVYQRVSLDRTLYLAAFKAEYQEIINTLKSNETLGEAAGDKIKEKLANIIRVVESYKNAQLDDSDDLSLRINYKQKAAEDILYKLNRLEKQLGKDINLIRSNLSLLTIERAVSFIGSMKFAEYFVLYNKLADVFDDTKTYQSNNERYIQELKKEKGDDWHVFKQDLFEITAFMQTNAQVDIYQRKQAETIGQVLDQLLKPDAQPINDYKTFSAAIDKELSDETTTFLKAFGRTASGLVSRKPLSKLGAAYNWLTADTENSGRIVGYMLDKYMHNLTFEQSVDKSLTRWFNYGKRSPFEINMIADVPYLSFPMRSINNWINRITDPRYLRLLTDMLDGIYGQFADEDGQFDEYTRYQMANGWIPIAGGIGLRAGNGAFDVMELFTEPTEQFSRRKSPWGRMIDAMGDYVFSKEKDGEKLISDVIKQSAMIGFATRGVNQITATSPGTRQTLSRVPVARKGLLKTNIEPEPVRGVTQSLSFAYWYDRNNNAKKFTPKKYDYSQGNGRYKYYENMYKDWFNKYGRMRKPKVDPYSLVKDIQWKQYVRARQFRNR